MFLQSHRHREWTCGCQRGGKVREGRMDEELGISRCKLLFIGLINNKVLQYSIGNYSQYSMTNHNGKTWKIIWVSKCKSLSCVGFFVTPWTIAYQAPLSIGFSRQECWSGQPFPSSGDLPNPGIKPRSPASQTDSLTSELLGKPRKTIYMYIKP